MLAPAKINLNLTVGPRRADGYHPVCSLMEPVSVFDTISVRPGRGGVKLAGAGIPAAENTVVKAALALEKITGAGLDVEIGLSKEIPVAAGLGGGSSDAAAALKLFISTFSLNVSEADLAALAFSVGADVPFFLRQGAQLAEGAGEILKAAGRMPEHWIVLLSPGLGLSTARVYHQFDAMGGGNKEDFIRRSQELNDAVAALESFESLCRVLQNDLEPAATSICDDIVKNKQLLKEAGSPAVLMSGSGPSVFGLFPNEGQARAAAERLRRSFDRVWVARPLTQAAQAFSLCKHKQNGRHMLLACADTRNFPSSGSSPGDLGVFPDFKILSKGYAFIYKFCR